MAFMANAHEETAAAALSYNEAERRHIYLTPKCYLEMITLYKGLLRARLQEVDQKAQRYEVGLANLNQVTVDVAVLQERLTANQGLVLEKQAAAAVVLQKLDAERAVVAEENSKAEKEDARMVELQISVLERTVECEQDLEQAEPLVQKSQKALETLNKTNLTELKSFKQPPPEVADVMACVQILFSPAHDIPRERERTWQASQKIMQRIDYFLQRLVSFDKEHIPQAHINALKPYLSKPEFQADKVATKSLAAAGLCEWVINIRRYHEIHCFVQPKRTLVEEGKAKLEQVNREVARTKTQVAKLQAKLAGVQAVFDEVDGERLQTEQEAKDTAKRLDLAQRLVRALHSEHSRWKQNVQEAREQRGILVGDVLLAAVFVAYMGGFGYAARQALRERWLARLDGTIPMSQRDPLRTLVGNARIAQWRNQQLPSDTKSTQNAAIAEFSQRWVLMVDPQLQGLRWVKQREEELRLSTRQNSGGAEDQSTRKLHCIRTGKGMMQVLERAISMGDTVIVEGLGEELDPVLTPVLERRLTKNKKGKWVLQLGGRDLEYHQGFRLILHTKLANPHYLPEVQAEATVVDFTVSMEGLEDQLLALVIDHEKPELERQRLQLVWQNNLFHIRMQELEDTLIEKIGNKGEDILADEVVIQSLETTKETSTALQIKVEETKATEAQITVARDEYRRVAQRGSLIFFAMEKLHVVNYMYQTHLDSFVIVFKRALEEAPRAQRVAEQLDALVSTVTAAVFHSGRVWGAVDTPTREPWAMAWRALALAASRSLTTMQMC